MAESDQDSLLAKSSLPAIGRVIDNTALMAYMTCPREYLFGMVGHWRAKGTKAPLHYGSVWHRAMELHYLTDGNRDVVIVGCEKLWKGADFGPDDVRSFNRLVVDYDRYRKEFGTPSHEAASHQGKTIGHPQNPMVEISTNAMAEGLLHPWAGKLDRPIEHLSSVYMEDHKTTTRFDKHYWKQFPLSNQMKGYTFLGRQVLPQLNVVGVRINLSHILKGSTTFHRQVFTFSKETIAHWVVTTNTWLVRLNRDMETLASLRKEYGDELHVTHPRVEEAFPAHYGDNGCSRKFGMCQYHEVCEVSPKHRRGALEQMFEVRPWNPLEMEDE